MRITVRLQLIDVDSGKGFIDIFNGIAAKNINKSTHLTANPSGH